MGRGRAHLQNQWEEARGQNVLLLLEGQLPFRTPGETCNSERREVVIKHKLILWVCSIRQRAQSPTTCPPALCQTLELRFYPPAPEGAPDAAFPVYPSGNGRQSSTKPTVMTARCSS